MKKIKENRAITLIALVITIIVLLILAGITLNLVLGERGIFKMAQEAGRNYTNAEKYEDNMIDKISTEAEDNLNIAMRKITRKCISKESANRRLCSI
ncbi:MAG: type II secretion system protein [Clostridia bacterium]|nr:type II secretion system protein [Clostridia bacterium]